MGRKPRDTGDIGAFREIGDVVESGVTLENDAKTPKSPKSVVIGSTFDVARMVQLDSEGSELLFEQTEDFLVLSEEIVRQLSRENRQRYSLARQFHDTWRGQKDSDFAESFAVDKEFVGSASDKLNELTVRKGIHTRWARPDRVNRYLERGYKVLSPDDAQTFLGAKGSRHEISRNGKTELVLMGIPETMFEAEQKKKVKKNNEMASLWKQRGVQQIEEQGSRGFVATEDDGRKWNDIENS